MVIRQAEQAYFGNFIPLFLQKCNLGKFQKSIGRIQKCCERASFMLCGQKKTYKVCRVLVQSMVWYSMKLQTINGGQARQLHKATGFEIIMPNILVHNSRQIFHHLSQMNVQACLFSAGGGQFCTIT